MADDAPFKSYDCMVLGAGIVGVATALHLQMAGRGTILIDRQPPGGATSYGNAGLIQRDAIVPYMMPRDWGTLLEIARNRSSQAHLHYSAVLKMWPWLLRYWRNSSARGMETGAQAQAPLVTRAVEEHETLMEAAGCADMLRRSGYLRLHRDIAELDKDEAEQSRLHQRYGVDFTVKNPDELEKLEPNLREEFVGGILLPQVCSLADPQALTRAYAAHFKAIGGHIQTGDAMTLEAAPDRSAWQVLNVEGPIRAQNAVVALGPWSADLLARLGLSVPLAVKRGYHMHYVSEGNATLNHPLLDCEGGFVMSPMARGIRITTGAEFASRDGAATPVQVGQVEKLAREMFPLGERVDDEPWLGARPCLPDMIPAVGPVPGQRGLWTNFAHHHLGLTLSAVTGRLIAQMITGQEPLADPAPYRLERFKH